MNVGPVLWRELRGEARRPFNYWLRTLGAGLLVAGLAPYAATLMATGPRQGAPLFQLLDTLFFWGTWILAPVLTADCISREKREGTLGLLFLTSLRARDIALAKGSIHALRGLTLWLAVLPVFVVPLLMGGVSATDLIRAVCKNASALLLALSAGLLASAWTREWHRALTLALLLSVVFAAGFIALHTAWLGGAAGGFFFNPFFLSSGARSWRRMTPFIWRGPGGAGAASLWPALELGGRLLGVASLTFLAVVSVAARQIRCTWRDEPPSARVRWWLATFCTPRFWQGFFRERLRRALDRNPIGWLQQYAWSARFTKWGWCLALVLAECLLLAQGYYEIARWQKPVIWALALGMAFSAAGSFRRERETGALELILVAPLSATQIVHGRLRGLWTQFAPSLAVVTLVLFYVPGDARATTATATPLLLALNFSSLLAISLVVPAVGLFFSLSARTFWTALGATLGVAWLGPDLLGQLANPFLRVPWAILWATLGSYAPQVEPASVLASLVRLALSLAFIRLTARALAQRRFDTRWSEPHTT